MILSWSWLSEIFVAEKMEFLQISNNKPHNDLRPAFKIQARKIKRFDEIKIGIIDGPKINSLKEDKAKDDNE